MYIFGLNRIWPPFGYWGSRPTLMFRLLKKCLSGFRKSLVNSKTVWSISWGQTNIEGPLQFNCKACEWVKWISLSRCPCRKNAGHHVSFMRSMFLNLSLIRYWSSPPDCSRTISLIDLNGLMRMSAHGLRVAAIREAGPEPIDRPHRII